VKTGQTPSYPSPLAPIGFPVSRAIDRIVTATLRSLMRASGASAPRVPRQWRETLESGIRIIEEIKRGMLFRVAAGYFVIAWLVIQAGDILLGNFAAPDWVFRGLVGVLIAGFPLALIGAWLLDSARKAARPEEKSIGRAGFFIRLALVVAMSVVLAWFGRDALRSGIELVNPERLPSIAVLPFTDMSAEGDQRFFAHGLSEEILNLLAGIRELKVSGRTSSFSFEGKDVPIPQIGEALGVAHVLEGSVRKSGDQLRVTAQLIDTRDGFHVWSRTYDRQLTELFAIQDEIADAIASQLRISLMDQSKESSDPNSTASIEAYEAFLEARQLIQGRSVAGIERARELLDRALALDPGFAPAMAQSALAWLMLSDARTTPGSESLATAISRAESLLERALEVDSSLASGYAVQGLLLTIEREFERADRSLARALEINPSHSDALNWRAINLRNAGRLRAELGVREQLLEIDPLNLSNLFNLSLAHLLRGQAQRSIEVARRLKRDFPGVPWGELAEAEALAASGRLALAQRLASSQLADGSGFLVSTASGIEQRLGRFERAMEVTGSAFATALVGLGRDEEAVALAREVAAASPGDSASMLNLLNVLSFADRHEAVLDYFEVRWGSLDALEDYFGFEDMTAEVTTIAAAQSVLGRSEALSVTLTRWGERLAHLREQGYAMPFFRHIDAGYRALAGDRERALELLEASIEGGYLNPFLARAAEFHALRGDPAFERLVERNYQRIDEERAELGLEPMIFGIDSTEVE
jgi:TolB-like protein